MQQITDDTILQCSPGVLKANVDDELVLMSIDCGKYYGVNRIAKDLWMLLEKPLSFADLCQKVVTIFDVSKQPNYRQDILEFVEALLKQKLVIIVN